MQAALRYTKAEALLSELERKKEDRLIYKEGSATPFSGVAIEIALEGYRRKEYHYQNGKLHGPQISWYQDGKLFGLAVYEHGQLIYRREYGPDASEGHHFSHTDDGIGQQTN